MNKAPTQKLPLGQTLKAALALYLWRFKKNILILVPVIFFQIYTQHKVLNLVSAFSGPSDADAWHVFTRMLAWSLLSSLVLFMAYADIMRRLFGFPVYLDKAQKRWTYLYWLFKKALTMGAILLLILTVGGMALVALASTMAMLLPALGIPVGAEPPLWLSSFFMLFGLGLSLWLVAHGILLSFPIIIDKNEGPIATLRRGFAMVKPHRQYAYQMAMIVLMIAILPNMIVGSLAKFFAVTPGASFKTLLFPALVSTSISDLCGLFLICVQLAAYRQLK